MGRNNQAHRRTTDTHDDEETFDIGTEQPATSTCLQRCAAGDAQSVLEDLLQRATSAWGPAEPYIALTAIRFGANKQSLAAGFDHHGSSPLFQIMGKLLIWPESQVKRRAATIIRDHDCDLLRYCLLATYERFGRTDLAAQHREKIRGNEAWVLQALTVARAPPKPGWRESRRLRITKHPIVAAYVQGDYNFILNNPMPDDPVHLMCRIHAHLRTGDLPGAFQTLDHAASIMPPQLSGNRALFNGATRIPDHINTETYNPATIDPRANLATIMAATTYLDHDSREFLAQNTPEIDLDDEALHVFRADARNPFRGNRAQHLEGLLKGAEDRMQNTEYREAATMLERIKSHLDWNDAQLLTRTVARLVQSMTLRALFDTAVDTGEKFLIKATRHLPEGDGTMLLLRTHIINAYTHTDFPHAGESHAHVLHAYRHKVPARALKNAYAILRRSGLRSGQGHQQTTGWDGDEPLEDHLERLYQAGAFEEILQQTQRTLDDPVDRMHDMLFRAAAYNELGHHEEIASCLQAARDQHDVAKQCNLFEQNSSTYWNGRIQSLNLPNPENQGDTNP